jgi:hypothetical protein
MDRSGGLRLVLVRQVRYYVCILVQYVRYQRTSDKLDKSQSDRTFLGILGFQTGDLQNLGVSEPRFTRTLAGRQDTFMSVEVQRT